MIYPEWEARLLGGLGLAFGIIGTVVGLVACYRAPVPPEYRKLLHALAGSIVTGLALAAGVIVDAITRRDGARLLLPLIWPFLALAIALSMIGGLLQGKAGQTAAPSPGTGLGGTKS